MRESGERQREKERKEKQRFRDKESSFRVITEELFFFNSRVKVLDEQC